MRNVVLCTLSHYRMLKMTINKRGILLYFLLFMIIVNVASIQAGSDPHSMGMGGARIMYGGGIEAAILNPAILGAQVEPWGGARLFPLGTSIDAGYWSDKLALTPYREFFSIDEDGQWQEIVAELIRSSFRVADKSPEETSKRITRQMKNGASIYSTAQVSLLGMTLGKVAVDIRTTIDAQVDIPGAPFLMLFSDKSGFEPGNELLLKHTGVQARVTTDISLGYGQPFDLSGIIGWCNELTQGVTDFQYSALGLGMTISLGNGFVDIKTKSGKLAFNDDASSFFMDAAMSLRKSGIDFDEKWKIVNPYKDGFSLAGFGAGVNAGAILYGEHTVLSVALRQLGPMVWRNVQGSDFTIRTKQLTMIDFTDDDLDVFDPEEGGSIPLDNELLQKRDNEVDWLPTRLNIGVGYRFNFRHSLAQKQRALSEYVNTSLEYEQTLAPWPNRSFVPRIAIGVENGFLWGILPVRAGLIFGGTERIASTIGFDIGSRMLRLQCAYKAIGTPVWYPKKGFEVAAGFSTEWGLFRDPDRDGISDKTDKCAFVPEDIDGFEDDDGCPDPDNDRDGIADTVDKCINVAEDLDGFEDSDGCPDFDNDADSVADTTDRCPMVPEDIDGFEDDDGCPDPDNDADGIPDTVDSCKNEKEDFDGVADTDGCPEIDADADQIPDSLDSCPELSETYNYVKDEDGCPDSVVQFTPEQKLRLDSLEGGLQFDATGTKKVLLQTSIDTLARLLNSDNGQRYILYLCDEAVTDSVVMNRLQMFRTMLITAGLDSIRIILPDSGAVYCSQENNRYGKILFVKVVDSKEEYDALNKKNGSIDMKDNKGESDGQSN